VLAAFWFDDGSQKTATTLFKAGIIDALCASGSVADSSEHDGAAGAGAAVGPAPSSAPGKLSVAALANAQSSDAIPLQRLQDQFFGGYTALGWAIKLNRPKVLQFFLRRGYKVTTPVDAAGNPAMHLVAICGTAEMVDMLLLDKTILFEQPNRAGWTAAMLAAKHRNFGIAKRLFDLRADARRSLDGAYAAWVLAFVRRKEENEVNTQTGRYGDDDVLYFDISPDPFYITWYTL
jgi:hypothetical protein